MCKENTSAYSVVIPTLNAENTITALLKALAEQTVKPTEIVVVDSQSEDQTVSIAMEHGATVYRIDRENFDHGGTRDWALRKTQTPYIVFMTQDALPADPESLRRLLAPLEADPQIAVVGGRQKAYPTATRHEQLVRQYNYPADSRVWSAEQIGALGVRAFLVSDVFAAYRRSAYLAVGGFDHPILTNEDMLMTQKLLDDGFTAAYAGDACVLHSHNFTWKQQYRRNYIIGMTLQRYQSRFQNVQETGEGTKLAKYVLTALAKEGRFADCLRFAVDCSARLLGNRAGRFAEARKEKEANDNTGNTACHL